MSRSSLAVQDNVHVLSYILKETPYLNNACLECLPGRNRGIPKINACSGINTWVHQATPISCWPTFTPAILSYWQISQLSWSTFDNWGPKDIHKQLNWMLMPMSGFGYATAKQCNKCNYPQNAYLVLTVGLKVWKRNTCPDVSLNTYDNSLFSSSLCWIYQEVQQNNSASWLLLDIYNPLMVQSH